MYLTLIVLLFIGILPKILLAADEKDGKSESLRTFVTKINKKTKSSLRGALIRNQNESLVENLENIAKLVDRFNNDIDDDFNYDLDNDYYFSERAVARKKDAGILDVAKNKSLISEFKSFLNKHNFNQTNYTEVFEYIDLTNHSVYFDFWLFLPVFYESKTNHNSNKTDTAPVLDKRICRVFNICFYQRFILSVFKEIDIDISPQSLTKMKRDHSVKDDYYFDRASYYQDFQDDYNYLEDDMYDDLSQSYIIRREDIAKILTSAQINPALTLYRFRFKVTESEIDNQFRGELSNSYGSECKRLNGQFEDENVDFFNIAYEKCQEAAFEGGFEYFALDSIDSELAKGHCILSNDKISNSSNVYKNTIDLFGFDDFLSQYMEARKNATVDNGNTWDDDSDGDDVLIHLNFDIQKY